jgi:Dullard-like phosphatase family protein
MEQILLPIKTLPKDKLLRRHSAIGYSLERKDIRNPLFKSEKALIKLQVNNELTKISNLEMKRVEMIQRSSKLIHKLSENYLDKLQSIYRLSESDEEDNDDESLISLQSYESDKEAKKEDKKNDKFEEILQLYYMNPKENIQGNYDAYITNCLKLITYFKPQTFFRSTIDEITKNISQTYGELEFNKTKQLLVLDLDETLIHADLDLIYSMHDYILQIADDKEIALNIRPYLLYFLDEMIKYFEIVVFTASCKEYADPIIDYIEKERKYFKYRLYREHCILYENFYFKDLTIFNKPLEQIILVENNLFAFPHYLSNGILITSFYNESEDIDLLSLVEFLTESIVGKEDVKKVIEETFMFNTLSMDLMHI